MAGALKRNTLFEWVPALGAISALGGDTLKLMPLGFERSGIVLMEGVNRLGRDPGQNHHVIVSSHVSRTHCEILLTAGKARVRDLGSHNGTYVNGERVTEKELRPGDQLGLSRQVTLVLVKDAVLEKPMGMEFNHEAMTPARLPPAGHPASSAADLEGGPSALGSHPELVQPSVVVNPSLASSPSAATSIHCAVNDGAVSEAVDAGAMIHQLERQRNIATILYQISVGCLQAENEREAEQLLANVLPHLAPMDLGFILYQSGKIWRAAICPGSRQRPADDTVRAFYQLALQRRSPILVRAEPELRALGLAVGSAAVVPLLWNDKLRGVLGTISDRPDAYNAEILDLLSQVSTVAAAALRGRSRSGR